MMKLAVIACLVGTALCAPLELPAGVSAAEFPCFPFNCDSAPAIPGAGFQHHAEQRILQQQFALSQPIVPEVPGLAAHFAAEAQVLAAQGRVPGSIVHSGNEARVRQAEADLIALQQQQSSAFTGLVGASGVIGPAGLVGPAGPVAF